MLHWTNRSEYVLVAKWVTISFYNCHNTVTQMSLLETIPLYGISFGFRNFSIDLSTCMPAVQDTLHVISNSHNNQQYSHYICQPVLATPTQLLMYFYHYFFICCHIKASEIMSLWRHEAPRLKVHLLWLAVTLPFINQFWQRVYRLQILFFLPTLI